MFDVAIIGSGYGGATVAARMAPLGKVVIIERGRRWKPGAFPTSIPGLASTYLTANRPDGLWAMRFGDGTGNAFASAYGGASVVNYGITVEPDAHVFEDWPVSREELAKGYAQARQVLGASPNPRADALGDKAFIDAIEPGSRYDIDNTIDWTKCDDCGECVPGCNHGAKRSLDTTYLAMAEEAGAEVRTQTEVKFIERCGEEGGFRLGLLSTGPGRETSTVRARRVVLAAGTFGTMELLHGMRRWVQPGPWFGKGLSMNGDGLAFLYNTRWPLSSHSGAPISTSARLVFEDEDGRKRTLFVMSGRVPKAAMRMSAVALNLLADVVAEPVSDGFVHEDLSDRVARRAKDLGSVEAGGAFSQSFMYKLDGQDSARGTARFTSEGRAVIDWPDYLEDPINRFAEARLLEWARKVGGTVVPNVARLPLPGMRAFSVHPLGGCRMGTSFDSGVCDAQGRIFRPGGGVVEGIRIADASLIPNSLGVPPSLTVAAIAERVAASLAAELSA